MNQNGVLVTGSSGYLGSQVVAALAARGGHDVVALDLREPAQREAIHLRLPFER